jgi:hypothetical protein
MIYGEWNGSLRRPMCVAPQGESGPESPDKGAEPADVGQVGTTRPLSASSPAAPTPITEDWLREVGFKWHEFDRQSTKHWLLWLADAFPRRMFCDHEDFGIELAADVRGKSEEWFCWLRADTAGRYHRFIHVRYLRYRHELIAMIEGLTGQVWNPANNMYGSMHRPEDAARLRENAERADQRLLRMRAKWQEIEKDDTRGRALPEHMEAAEKAREAKD